VTRWIVVASVVVLTVVGAVAIVATRDSPSHSATPDAVALTSSARHQFTDVAELVGASDLIVVGRVMADEDGRTFGNPGAEDSDAPSSIRSHVLTLQVDRVLAGAEPTSDPNAPQTDVPKTNMVVLVEEEYALGDGTAVRVDGMRRGRVGDRGVWFLAASTDPDFPAYAIVNAQGRYLFARGEVRGGDRTDTLVRAVERLGPTQLQDAVTAAATSISR
jgi:hypothetical protein